LKGLFSLFFALLFIDIKKGKSGVLLHFFDGVLHYFTKPFFPFSSNPSERKICMQPKPIRFFSLAIFLAVILITMLLSRAEEQRKANAALSAPTSHTQTQTTLRVS
jgi:hypothetical protein